MIAKKRHFFTKTLILIFFTAIFGSIQLSVFCFEPYEVHTIKPLNWDSLFIYMWNNEGRNNAEWPGEEIEKPASDGWYSYAIERPIDGLIFNAGSEGPQTADLRRHSEGWYSIRSGRWHDSVPEQREMIKTESILPSPIIEGPNVTFNFSSSAHQIYVAGDFSEWELLPLDSQEDNHWHLTLNTGYGDFAYAFAMKHAPGEDLSWHLDPSNTETVAGPYGADSRLRVPVFYIDVPAFFPTTEPVSLNAYLDDIEVSAEWSVSPDLEGISIEDEIFSVEEEYVDKLEGKSIIVRADYEGYTDSSEVILHKELYTFTINYYRYDEDYRNWNLWLWIDGEDGQEYAFNKDMQEGFYQGQHILPASEVNIIPRRGHWEDQETARRAKVQEGNEVEVWLIQDVEEVYYSMKDADTRPRIFAALLDARDILNAALSEEVTDAQLENFRLRKKDTDEEISISVSPVFGYPERIEVKIEEPEKIDVRELYILESDDFIGTEVTMRTVLDDDKFYHNDWLGIRYSADSTSFRVWAPTAQKVQLALYNTTTREEYDQHGNIPDNTNHDNLYDMERHDNGVWETLVENDLDGKFYMYKVHFANGKTHYAKDPYAIAVAPNGQRSAVVDLSQNQPENWKDYDRPRHERWTAGIIYELHVRDFSIDKDSGISKENRGKYLAFTEEGTQGPGDVQTGIDHLQELGITHLHLLPVYDFRSVNELTVDDPDSDDPKFNWGYDPHNFNVPEGSYASDVWNPAVRIKEFRKMVQALHKAGIEVIMDVVYNHTYEIDNGPFEKVVPGYYYRTDERGRFTNGSGCGNEVASERPMVRKYILDSLHHWAKQYNIDGFRFDLMGLIDITTMEKAVNMLHEEFHEHMLVYGEPWAAGPTPLPGEEMTLKGTQRGKNFAVFNDHFRNAIKGGSDDRSKGFATCLHNMESTIIQGIMGALDDFTDCPTETINYVTCHDNLALWDKVIRTRHQEEDEGFVHIHEGRLAGEDAEKFNSIEEAVTSKSTPYHKLENIDDPIEIMNNETVRRAVLCNGIVLTSQGIPFLHAGVETLRTKFGDHNSYRSPDIINKLRWERKERFKPVFDYYRGLITLRRNHPAFQLNCPELIRNHILILEAEDKVIMYMISGQPLDEIWENIIVIYNANHHDIELTLPEGHTWNVVVDYQYAGIEVLRTVEEEFVRVPSYSMKVLHDQPAQ